MYHQWGVSSSNRGGSEPAKIIWDSKKAVNPHQVVVGTSGSGKTSHLRALIRSMAETSDLDRNLRVHVVDFHGDIDVPNASTIMFTERSTFGFNPLRVNPDPIFGSLRKTVQMFIDTMESVFRQLGGKQEACLW